MLCWSGLNAVSLELSQSLGGKIPAFLPWGHILCYSPTIFFPSFTRCLYPPSSSVQLSSFSPAVFPASRYLGQQPSISTQTKCDSPPVLDTLHSADNHSGLISDPVSLNEQADPGKSVWCDENQHSTQKYSFWLHQISFLKVRSCFLGCVFVVLHNCGGGACELCLRLSSGPFFPPAENAMLEPRGQAPLAFRDIIRVHWIFSLQSVLRWDFLSVFASQNWQIGHHDFLYLFASAWSSIGAIFGGRYSAQRGLGGYVGCLFQRVRVCVCGLGWRGGYTGVQCVFRITEVECEPCSCQPSAQITRDLLSPSSS